MRRIINSLTGEEIVDLDYTAPKLDPAEALAQERKEALAYLASTDWMVVRMAETGKPIPSDVLEARERARTKAGSV